MGTNIYKQQRDIRIGQEILELYMTGKYSYRQLGRKFDISHEKARQLLKLAIMDNGNKGKKAKTLDNS